MSEVVMSRRRPAALAVAWLLLAAACSGGSPGAQGTESAVEHGGGPAVLTDALGERAASGAAQMHPCQWEESCVNHGGGVSLHCGGRWVCPASDQPGSTGALAVTTLRR